MWSTLFILVTIYLVQVLSSNESLKGHSVIYGLSLLTKNSRNSSTLCYQQLQELYTAINSRKVWGLKVMDASGEPNTGFIYGNNIWIGSQLQCEESYTRKSMEINYDRIKRPVATPFDYPPFPMRFSVMRMIHNNTLQYHKQMILEWTVQVGLCVPESCTTNQLWELMEIYLNKTYLDVQKIYNLNLELNEVKKLSNVSAVLVLPKTILFLSVLSIILALTIIGTIYDVRRHKRQKMTILSNNNKEKHSTTFVPQESSNILGKLVTCFSFYKNNKSLMKTTVSPDSISCLHGLKFFGMLWVCMIHSIFYEADYFENPAVTYNLAEPLVLQIFSNGTYSVDTFLFISGFLTTYMFLKFSNKRRVNIFTLFEMLLHRILRLSFPYLFVILLTNVGFTYFMETSPLLTSERLDILCDQYWWRNILYINNFYPRAEMCMNWSYYLSIDTQMFVIAAVLLILSTKYFKLSACIAGTLIVVNIISVAYMSYKIQYVPTMDEQFRTLDFIYDLTWQRSGPYIIGMITAYVLVIKLNMKLNISAKTRIILWCLLPWINIYILFSLYTRNLSPEYSAIYMGISRTLWGVGIAWIVVACCTGNARALEKFLSYKGFIPLSKMTYCCYLINPLVIHFLFLGSGATDSASIAKLMIISQGTTLITFYFAYLLSVMVEAPFLSLSKLLMTAFVRKKKSVPSEDPA